MRIQSTSISTSCNVTLILTVLMLCILTGCKTRHKGFFHIPFKKDRLALVDSEKQMDSTRIEAMIQSFLLANPSPKPTLNNELWEDLESRWSELQSFKKQISKDSLITIGGAGRITQGNDTISLNRFGVYYNPKEQKAIGLLVPEDTTYFNQLGDVTGYVMSMAEIERYTQFKLDELVSGEDVDWEFWGRSSPRDNEVTFQALVIGNDEYQSYPLQKASIDATKVGEAILSLGGSVEYGINVSGDSLKRMIQSFYGRSDEFDWNIFYYAGHGTQGDLGMTMYGIDDDDAVAQVPLDYLLRPFALRSDEGCPQVAAFIDACRTGPGGIGAEQPAFVKVQFSTQGNQVAFDSEFNGVYARILAERLKENPPITLDSFLTGVTVRVYEETAHLQMPQKHFGDLIGERSLTQQHPYKKN